MDLRIPHAYYHGMVAELTDGEIKITAILDLPSSKMPRNDRIIRYTLYFYAYSFRQYVKDLFVRQEYRSMFHINTENRMIFQPFRHHTCMVVYNFHNMQESWNLINSNAGMYKVSAPNAHT